MIHCRPCFLHRKKADEITTTSPARATRKPNQPNTCFRRHHLPYATKVETPANLRVASQIAKYRILRNLANCCAAIGVVLPGSLHTILYVYPLVEMNFFHNPAEFLLKTPVAGANPAGIALETASTVLILQE